MNYKHTESLIGLAAVIVVVGVFQTPGRAWAAAAVRREGDDLKVATLPACLGLTLPAREDAALVAQARVPSYAELLSGPGQCLPVQGRPFWFTLGGGEDSPAHVRTLEKQPMADRGLVSCGVAEWGYSFHHLKNGQEDGAGYKHYGGYPTPPNDRAEAMEVVRRYYLRLREETLRNATPQQRKLFSSVNGHYCYQHYACEWGCDLVGSEVGEEYQQHPGPHRLHAGRGPSIWQALADGLLLLVWTVHFRRGSASHLGRKLWPLPRPLLKPAFADLLRLLDGGRERGRRGRRSAQLLPKPAARP